MSAISPNEGYIHGGETPRQRDEYHKAVLAVGQAATQQALEEDHAYHTEAHPVD